MKQTKPFRTLGALLLVGVALSLVGAEAAPATKKPNIVLILVDDLGYHALRQYGSHSFKTPNLDKLSASGMSLMQCHARAMCSPSRHVLLTGQGLQRGDWTRHPTLYMPELLKKAGYKTGFCGKWMIGEMDPWNRGFDEGVVQVNWYRYWGRISRFSIRAAISKNTTSKNCRAD